jgi:hypothetical protein
MLLTCGVGVERDLSIETPRSGVYSGRRLDHDARRPTTAVSVWNLFGRVLGKLRRQIDQGK